MGVPEKEITEELSVDSEEGVWDLDEAVEAYESEMPVYTIVPVLQTPQVNPGDSINIDIYITGAGQMSRNKLYLNYSYENVFQSSVGTISPGFKVEETEGGTELRSKTELDDETELEWELGSVGNTIGLPDWIFHPIPDKATKTGQFSGIDGAPETYPQRLSEVSLKGEPPLQLTLNTANGASDGDYDVTIVFIYKSGKQIYRDERKVQFHVNNLREEYEPTPTIIAVMAGLAAVISLIYQTGVINYLLGLF